VSKFDGKLPGDEFNRMMRGLKLTSNLQASLAMTRVTQPLKGTAAATALGISNPAVQRALRMNEFSHTSEALKRIVRPHLDITGNALRAALGTGRVDLSGINVAGYNPKLTAQTQAIGATFKFPQAFHESVVTKLQVAMRTASERIAALMPREWEDLDLEETDAAIALAVEQGIATVWAPNLKVIRDLLAADTCERLDVLLRHQDIVLDDVEQALSELESPELGDSPALAQRALKALRDGHGEASQALTAVVLTTVIGRNFGKTGIGAALKSFSERHPDEVPLQSFRLVVILRAVATCLTWTSDGDVDGFHRNAAVHHASLQQYSPANALAGLMLLTNLMREADEIYGRRAKHALEDLDEAA
jgi:hypothetical protein